MLNIQVIATGSTGNCILLKYGDNRLLLEAGIPFRRISEATGFRLAKIDGCLLTHEHGDHAKSIRRIMETGIDCFMSAGTAEALELLGHRVHRVRHGDQFQAGPWHCVGFNAIHDAAEPLNYLIKIADEKILFVTDSAMIQPTFKGLTRIIIECNWDEINSDCPYKDRLYTSHLSLQMASNFLLNTDRSLLQEVVLIHMSERNIDAEKALWEISKIPCGIVRKG